MAEQTKVKLTGANTHRATERGYAIDGGGKGAGQLVEAGELVPAGVAVGSWMEPVKKGDRALLDAVEEAQEPIKRDVDLTQLTMAALQAMAAERGVNVKGLNKDDLITAIKAADDPTR
jgi:hypothetical protein